MFSIFSRIYTITGNNTFNNFTIDTPQKLLLAANTNQTVSSFYTNGSAGNIIELYSTSGASAFLTDTSGTNYAHYTNISNVTAQGGATWDATDNCVNVSNATGWTFASAGGDDIQIIFID